VNTESLPNWRTMIEQSACTQDQTASGVKHVANKAFGHATRRFQAVCPLPHRSTAESEAAGSRQDRHRRWEGGTADLAHASPVGVGRSAGTTRDMEVSTLSYDDRADTMKTSCIGPIALPSADVHTPRRELRNSAVRSETGWGVSQMNNQASTLPKLRLASSPCRVRRCWRLQRRRWEGASHGE